MHEALLVRIHIGSFHLQIHSILCHSNHAQAIKSAWTHGLMRGTLMGAF